ncbi:MAG: hypothetical protein HY562_12090 [Ignavibacteriales bacterium]|nr:hypothetical protein [Ignavibacteriales bacterium]
MLDIATTSQSLAHTFITPPGKTILLYGDKSIFPLSLTLAAHAIGEGNTIAVVDGCNRFDVHLLTRFARERGLDPQAFLRRAFVSRGFTCYQMEQAIAGRLPAFLKSIHSSTAMIFGLLDTFYDEQARFREVQQILTRLLASFEQMKRSGISLLLACLELNVLPEERNQLFATLKHGVDSVYRLELNEEGKPRMLEETVFPVTAQLKTTPPSSWSVPVRTPPQRMGRKKTTRKS